MTRDPWKTAFVLCALLVSVPVFAQGPGSCGFHLDIRTSETSSHSAVADIPNAPGQIVGMPPFSPGNPYVAHAGPGTPMSMSISGNSLAYGPAPFGPGSCLTIFWSLSPTMIGIPVGPPFIAPCGGGPLIVGILPISGTIMDSCGLNGGPPFGVFDPGGGRFTFGGTYPIFGMPTFALQAAGITPAGSIWVTNAVTLVGGSNPFELPPPAPVPCTPNPPPLPPNTQAELSLPVPFPFSFYGFPVAGVDMDTNGFVAFGPPGLSACYDPTGDVGDFGCSPATPSARARIDVNHTNNDRLVPIAPPFPISGSMTSEYRPAGPFWQEALILRWKNMPLSTALPGVAGLSTGALALELHGPLCGGCFPAVTPDRIIIVRTSAILAGQCGIGPGLAGQGFGGPPPFGATCSFGSAGIPLMSTFAPPAGLPFLGVPGGTIHMNSAAGSAALLNSAVEFTPIPGPVPLAYRVIAY